MLPSRPSVSCNTCATSTEPISTGVSAVVTVFSNLSFVRYSWASLSSWCPHRPSRIASGLSCLPPPSLARPPARSRLNSSNETPPPQPAGKTAQTPRPPLPSGCARKRPMLPEAVLDPETGSRASCGLMSSARIRPRSTPTEESLTTPRRSTP